MVTSLTISTKANPFLVLISDIPINNYVQEMLESKMAYKHT